MYVPIEKSDLVLTLKNYIRDREVRKKDKKKRKRDKKFIIK